MSRKAPIEKIERAHFYIPKSMLEFLDDLVEKKGYGANRSSIVREMIEDRRRAITNAENSNR